MLARSQSYLSEMPTASAQPLVTRGTAEIDGRKGRLRSFDSKVRSDPLEVHHTMEKLTLAGAGRPNQECNCTCTRRTCGHPRHFRRASFGKIRDNSYVDGQLDSIALGPRSFSLIFTTNVTKISTPCSV